MVATHADQSQVALGDPSQPGMYTSLTAAHTDPRKLLSTGTCRLRLDTRLVSLLVDDRY
jgi:hypothetical protein